ncbi:phiSA1p31-related protein [Streptomyces sp. Isolate_219]|uniref:phiSA1p31-related protein n=1 Tax=Streptomyces sp. Isolate_219 TaxID=2950110 RepID=UPI0021C8B626|nr:phiSA1p31-related protein [Streptomyces sp. Isolate_219]MCR8576450.1 phiSA1p31-related protein [Streptomyces sp. Isolate_219]
MTEIKVGDKVATNLFLATHGTVVHGPFPSATLGHSALLIELADGPRCGELVTVRAYLTKPYVTTYAPGTEVTRAGHPGAPWKVEAGPFNGGLGPFYVVSRGGTSVPASAAGLWPVDPKPARTYEYDGVTYDLDAEYRDRVGDVYEFTGKFINGVPAVTMYSDADNPDTLDDIVRDWGPLTRV